jgi:hypothetical protein
MLMGPGLDNTGKVFYTINNKRKEAGAAIIQNGKLMLLFYIL